MMFPSVDRQRGQALLEASFICMMLITLLLAIQFSGHFRTRTLELLGDSSYQTFLKSEPSAETKSQLYAQEKRGSSKHKGLLETYIEELLNVQDQGMIHVRRATNPATDSRLTANHMFNAVSLQRTSYLYVQEGQGRSDREVQSRIGRSKAAWRDVTSPTQQMLQSHIYPLKKIDVPWRRGQLHTDWLSGWAGQSPRVPTLKMRRE
jgi:hypothetical protein